VTKEGVNVIGVYDHQDKVDMGCLYDDVADPNGVQLACCSEAALYDRLTQWISEKQQSLLEAECAK
jgi:hypothetical protein